MTVELPRWTVADCVALVLGVAAGGVLEVVMAGHEGAPRGLGMAVAAALAAWQRWRCVRRPRRLEISTTAGSRLLGPTVVLHWRSAGGRGAVWLTPADLPRDTLRRLAVQLVSHRPTGR